MKILIAEDDITSRLMLTGILKKWGFEPVVTENGEQAWEALQQAGAPKLVLLDWNMPIMDGLEVTKRIRKQNDPEPPYVILLTARDEKSDIVLGLAAGANDYVSKPYDQDELRARLHVGKRMVDLQHALIEQSLHDPLTGTLNRGAIMELLEKEIYRAKRGKLDLAISMLDIDHFKTVNDSYGHPVGDDLLCGFAKVLQSNLRVSDHLGRYGGDEFLIVAPEIAFEDTMDLLSRMCKNIAETQFETRAGKLSITISVGAANISKDASVDMLLAEADAALYQAKEKGRNQVVHSEGPGG